MRKSVKRYEQTRFQKDIPGGGDSDGDGIVPCSNSVIASTDGLIAGITPSYPARPALQYLTWDSLFHTELSGLWVATLNIQVLRTKHNSTIPKKISLDTFFLKKFSIDIHWCLDRPEH